MKLNLGCGKDYREGWTNLDIGNKDIYGRDVKVDIVHDLNKFPWPFKNNQFEEILMKGVLEHIRDVNKGIKELSRISDNNAIVKIYVPYFTSYFAYREINTHKFSLNSIQIFQLFKNNKMVLISKKLKNNNRLLSWTESFLNQNEKTQNFYERFLSGIFPVNQIEWIFRVEKSKNVN